MPTGIYKHHRNQGFQKGRVVLEETKRKISEANKKSGKIPPSRLGTKLTEEHKRKIGLASRGRKRPLEVIMKGAVKRRGKNHWNWKGGTSNSEDKKIRKSVEYTLWRRTVFERDNYQCVMGGKEHGSRIEADHIKPFALFPELRFAIDNGRTLCVECHKKTETWGGKSKKNNLISLNT